MQRGTSHDRNDSSSSTKDPYISYIIQIIYKLYKRKQTKYIPMDVLLGIFMSTIFLSSGKSSLMSSRERLRTLDGITPGFCIFLVFENCFHTCQKWCFSLWFFEFECASPTLDDDLESRLSIHRKYNVFLVHWFLSHELRVNRYISKK